jgi:predicted unusual protein kinase regulating ubiquinone biosynthesis (AarF/ABC1/UbiB family)
MFIPLIKKSFSIVDFAIFIKLFYRDDYKSHHDLLKSKIQNLGIVFIKLAQWYSTFGSLYESKQPQLMKILSSFQNQVDTSQQTTPNFANNEYISQNINLDSITYLASGSIGNVYKGRLNNGSPVVIKIQHPHVKQDFKVWCQLIGIFYSCIKPFLHCEAAEILEILKSQFDFKIEGANMEKFAQLYENDSKVLKIPHLYYCNETILISEYVGSFNNQEELPLSFSEKVEKLCILKCWLMDQIVLKKTIHGDLHNGNWGITLDQQSIVLYDFGYIYELPNLSKDFVVSLLNKNACSVSEKILELFSIPKSVQNLQSIQELMNTYQLGKKFSLEFITKLLEILYKEKLVVFNKKVAFLLNIVICLNHIHQIDFLQDAEESMEYNYLTLEKNQILHDYRETIVYPLVLARFP